MLYDIAAMDAKPRYNLLTSLVVPRPIAWVTSNDQRGRVNAAPFSFFNLMAGTPPVVVLGIGTRAGHPKDSARNIMATGEFVINTVSLAQLDAMNVTAIDFDEDVNEIVEAGLDTVPSHAVGPPRIAGSPAALECLFTRSVELGAGRDLIIGEIIYAHVEDRAVINRARGHIDAAELDVVGRMHGGGWYTTTSTPFRLGPIPLTEGGSHASSDIQKSGSFK